MRLEYKFLVNKADLNKLRNRLLPFVELDPFVKEGSVHEYTVRSIYYDSSNFDFYFEKIDGYKIRKKLRIRSYDKVNNNNLVFLEIKHKYDNFIGKNRSPLLIPRLFRRLGKLRNTSINSAQCSRSLWSSRFRRKSSPLLRRSTMGGCRMI